MIRRLSLSRLNNCPSSNSAENVKGGQNNNQKAYAQDGCGSYWPNDASRTVVVITKGENRNDNQNNIVLIGLIVHG